MPPTLQQIPPQNTSELHSAGLKFILFYYLESDGVTLKTLCPRGWVVTARACKEGYKWTGKVSLLGAWSKLPMDRWLPVGDFSNESSHKIYVSITNNDQIRNLSEAYHGLGDCTNAIGLLQGSAVDISRIINLTEFLLRRSLVVRFWRGWLPWWLKIEPDADVSTCRGWQLK